MKASAPERADIDPRYVQLVMQKVIRDVFDALVELITNSDDSYHRLYSQREINQDGGPISIEILRHSKGSSWIRVKDRAEGMTLSEMRERIKGIGKRTSGDKDRGFMGRGAKECAVLGRAIFESIKNDRYYKSEFNSNLEFIPYEPPEKATPGTRERLGIRRGNGTVVSLEVRQQYRMPRFETILRDLRQHFPLRDILAKESPCRVIVKNLADSRQEPLIYYPPVGESKLDEEYDVTGYPGVKAKLRIWRSPELLDGYGDRFRKDGFIIKGERAIHECSLLTEEFEKDPLARRYFGRIECACIDQLCREYDKCREDEETPPENNFCLIIDPDRQKGLRRDHPFTKAIFQIPTERLRTLIAEDREQERKEKSKIANEETQKRLDHLARAASTFLRQQMEDLEEITTGDEWDRNEFAKEGMLIYPRYFKVAVGETGRLAVYVRESIAKGKRRAVVKSENGAISVLDTLIELRQHKKRPDMLLGYFRIEGNSEKDAVLIEATLGEEKSTTAIAQVVNAKIEERIFSDPLEFEYKTYRVKEGKQRAMRLFAKYPEVVSREMEVNVSFTDSVGVPIKGRCRMVPVGGRTMHVEKSSYGDGN